MQALQGKCLSGRYLVGELIGTGGMAVVYKGHDIRTGRTVAIKVLRQEFNEDAEFVVRFEREAQAASSLTHENLIDLYDVDVENDVHFIIMEFVDGLTLKELISRQGKLDNYTAISIARQMCLALKLVHEARIIHRDIKSQNILLDRKGIAKLADFGIAKATDTNTITMSTEKGVLGSVHYFSPEQAKGERVSTTSDLYSLGVVLYEMLTGKLPYDGDTPVSVALHHLNSPVPSARRENPRVTRALDEIIQKAMDKDATKRYQSAQEMYNDLCMALVYPEGGFVRHGDDLMEAIAGKKKETVQSSEKEAVPAALEPQTQELARAVTKAKEEKNNKKKPRKGQVALITTLSIVFVAAAVVFCVVLFQNGLVPGWRRAPFVIGMQLDAATGRFSGEGLVIEVEGSRYDESILPGTIIAQTPGSGSPIRRDGTVLVTICRGPEFPSVPSVVGAKLEDAREALRLSGLRVGAITQDPNSTEPRGTVLHQGTTAGQVVKNQDAVDLVVSDRPAVRTVPNVSDLTVDEARMALENFGLTLGEVHEEYSSEVGPNKVVRQEPASGQTATDGDSVSIWINVAPAQYTYFLDIDIEQDDTLVRIYQEDKQKNEVKLIVETTRDKGNFSTELNLVSTMPGENIVIVLLGDEEYLRESVMLEELS